MDNIICRDFQVFIVSANLHIWDFVANLAPCFNNLLTIASSTMKKQAFLFILALGASSAWAQQATVSGPDQQLKVDVSVDGGIPSYSVTYKGKTILGNGLQGTEKPDAGRDLPYGPHEAFGGGLQSQRTDRHA